MSATLEIVPYDPAWPDAVAGFAPAGTFPTQAAFWVVAGCRSGRFDKSP